MPTGGPSPFGAVAVGGPSILAKRFNKPQPSFTPSLLAIRPRATSPCGTASTRSSVRPFNGRDGFFQRRVTGAALSIILSHFTPLYSSNRRCSLTQRLLGEKVKVMWSQAQTVREAGLVLSFVHKGIKGLKSTNAAA